MTNKQLVFPFKQEEDKEYVQLVKNAIISSWKNPDAEMWGDPIYDPNEDEWVYVVAVTSTGPLVRAASKVSSRT